MASSVFESGKKLLQELTEPPLQPAKQTSSTEQDGVCDVSCIIDPLGQYATYSVCAAFITIVCVCVCVIDFQKKTAPTYDEEPSDQLKFLEAIVMKNMQAETLGNYGVTSCNKTGTHLLISQIIMTIYIFLPF